jgi:hypothetical protein
MKRLIGGWVPQDAIGERSCLDRVKVDHDVLILQIKYCRIRDLARSGRNKNLERASTFAIMWMFVIAQPAK